MLAHFQDGKTEPKPISSSEATICKAIFEENAMTLSAVEAFNRVNESVTVEMIVRRTKSCSKFSKVFLDSEANHRDPKNLGVVVTECAAASICTLL